MKNPQISQPSAAPQLLRRSPELVFSPLAWLKLQFFLHAGDTEIGGFGISAPADLLYIEDFVTVKQAVSSVTVEFDDQAVADYVDGCVDQGIPPQRCMRCWIHTHPGESPEPSLTDERNFQRVFGNCDWSVMFIIGRTGNTYARLAFSAGPGGGVLLPVAVDWPAWPQILVEQNEQLPQFVEAWMNEYGTNIHPVLERAWDSRELAGARIGGADRRGDRWDYLDYYGMGDDEMALTYGATHQEVGL